MNYMMLLRDLKHHIINQKLPNLKFTTSNMDYHPVSMHIINR